MAKKVTCTIEPGGNITAEVSGVSGPSCKDDLTWLEKVGLVEAEEPTPDYDRSPDLTVDENLDQAV